MLAMANFEELVHHASQESVPEQGNRLRMLVFFWGGGSQCSDFFSKMADELWWAFHPAFLFQAKHACPRFRSGRLAIRFPRICWRASCLTWIAPGGGGWWVVQESMAWKVVGSVYLPPWAHIPSFAGLDGSPVDLWDRVPYTSPSSFTCEVGWLDGV